MTMSRSDRRSARGERCVDVYSAEMSCGWRIIRQVTARYAYDKVIEGRWRELFDDLGNFLGVQVVNALKTDQDLPSGTSATTITARDSMLFAGLGGPSRTITMNEDARISRFNAKTCRALPPEDHIERVIAKVQQWPFPASRIDSGDAMRFGDRAVRVYPRFE